MVPDAASLPEAEFYLVQQEMMQLCAQQKDRFAILNTLAPGSNVSSDVQQFRNQTYAQDLSYAAVYYPWLVLSNGDSIPPSGAIAGIYAQTDNNRGVWKAPANVVVTGITGLTRELSREELEIASADPTTGKSINPIMRFPQQGILVWGARTLNGNSLDWRYVPTRRLSIMLNQSIQKGLEWAVFEPNDANLWSKVETDVSNYLTSIWRDGGLAGATPDEAFLVSCGLGKTMTAQDVLEKRLIVEWGFAPIRPAEFVVSRLVLDLKE